MMKKTSQFSLIIKSCGFVTALFLIYFSQAFSASAATLLVSPSTGVYTSNSTFTARVNVNSSGAAINAAEGTLSFNPKELSVVSVSRSGSIFNLWVTEPAYSNTAGTISFSGGLPSGYTGASGNIMTITFRAIGSGAAKINFSTGSVLANDGRGTNVLTGMNGGSFTIQAASTQPEAEEVVVEYVAPANTPAAPKVTSSTHTNPDAWHTVKEAVLTWNVPGDVTAVRTLLDAKSSTVPTKVYDTPISNITLSDLEEGESYFHVQFKNADGWGKITHYRLAVDSEKPSSISIVPAEGVDQSNPEPQLSVVVTDAASEVKRFVVKVGDSEPFEVIKDTSSSTIKLPVLLPGYYTVIIEAFDEAGNSIIGSYSFNIDAFEAPVFIEYPTEINEEVIPVIKGKTRANASIEVTLQKIGAEPTVYKVGSDSEGNFTFIPDGRFSTGVYQLTARATDQHGAQSDLSDAIKIAVQQPGFIRIGSFLVSVLSVVIPLIVLLVLTVLGSWYLLAYMRRFRGKIGTESSEALEILHREFSSLQLKLREQESIIQSSRKTKKLSKAESDMIEVLDLALQSSQRNVEKEIKDVQQLVTTK